MCENDGGYYAIKGFLYQFDKTMIELLRNEDTVEIHIEDIQDINYENYVIQVKHKETATFTNSKIREPIIQLLELYKEDRNKKFCLHGYFMNEQSHEMKFLKIEQLNEVLKYRDEKKTKELEIKFPEDIRNGFIENFILYFGEDLENQFKYLLDEVKNQFELKNIDDAIIYHSIIREKLFQLAIEANKRDRIITKKQLKEYVNRCNKNIFYGYYDQIIGREKYIKLVKNKYFKIKSANINNFERLFAIDCNHCNNETAIRKIIDNISNKYYKKSKSPAPYISFRGIDEEVLTNVKREMYDDNIKFSDGTYFNGDRFRINDLKNDGDKNGVRVKIIKDEKIDELLNTITIKEYYNLFFDTPLKLNLKSQEIAVQINDIEEIIEIIS